VLAGCQKPAEPGPSPLPTATGGAAKAKAPAPAEEKPAAAATETKAEVANLKNADGQYLCVVDDKVIEDPATALKVVEGGKTVYLCCQQCVDKFKLAPAKYMPPDDDKPAKVDETKIGNAKNLEGKYICPVRYEPIADLASAPKFEYGGKTYYFCCPGCDDEFKKDPQRYIDAAAPAPKGATKSS
jgi:YHS domain-containing protein